MSQTSITRPAEGPAPAAGGRRGMVLAILCVSLLIVSLDTTVLNVALPTLVRDLHATETQLQWIVDAYSLVLAGLMLVSGSLADRLGRKWVFLTGLLVFAAGSAGSAWSGSPGALIAARAFMGIGAAGIMPSTLSILTDAFPAERDRVRALGVWSGTTGVGLAVGPIVGGWLLNHFWWGSVFLINVPIAAASALLAALFVRNSRNHHAKRPDPVGTGLSVVGLGLLLWGIIEAPTRTWTSSLVLAALSGGIAVLAVFVWWERRSEHPMLEMRFFDDPRFSAAIGSVALVVFALIGGLFILTQYLQFSLGYTPLQTGLRIGPVAAVVLVVAPLSSLLDRWLGTKPVVFTGLTVICAAMVMLSRVTVAGTYLDALPAFVLLGVGAGLVIAPSTNSVMGSLPLEHAGVGAATSGAGLQVGGSLGVGIMGSLLDTRYQSRLTPLIAHQAMPAAVHHAIVASLGGALQVAGSIGGDLGATLSAVAKSAFVSGMSLAVLVGGCTAAAGALVVLALLPNRARSEGSESSGGDDRSAGEEGAGNGTGGPAHPQAGPSPRMHGTRKSRWCAVRTQGVRSPWGARRRRVTPQSAGPLLDGGAPAGGREASDAPVPPR